MNYWKGKRVFITGITGFIGHALAKHLHTAGALVYGLTRRVNACPPSLDDCVIYSGDVSDYECVREVLSYNEVDTVFHLAANAIVRSAARDPMTTYGTNVMGTVAVLEACRSLHDQVKKIVVASSDKAYGDHMSLPYTENHSLQPNNTYDTSKACMDMIARAFGTNYDMPVVVTRCSNVYGPGDPNMSRIVPNSIARIRTGLAPSLYSDVAEMEREFIYIDDVIDAYELLGRRDDLSDAYNIGGTGPVVISDLVEKISEKMCWTGGTKIVERAATFREIKRQYIDATLLSRHGWEPKVSLDDGLERTIGWYK